VGAADVVAALLDVVVATEVEPAGVGDPDVHPAARSSARRLAAYGRAGRATGPRSAKVIGIPSCRSLSRSAELVVGTDRECWSFGDGASRFVPHGLMIFAHSHLEPPPSSTGSPAPADASTDSRPAHAPVRSMQDRQVTFGPVLRDLHARSN
jgi:hypothetical protein